MNDKITMIRREDALECFMGLDRIGDIKDAIAALEPQSSPRDDAIKSLMDAATEALSELESGGKTMQTVQNLRAAITAAKAVQHG